MSSSIAAKDSNLAPVFALLEQKPPVLVEVRFPGCATSPDWYLCEDEDRFAEVTESLNPGTEIYATSVWDLPRGMALRLTK